MNRYSISRLIFFVFFFRKEKRTKTKLKKHFFYFKKKMIYFFFTNEGTKIESIRKIKRGAGWYWFYKKKKKWIFFLIWNQTNFPGYRFSMQFFCEQKKNNEKTTFLIKRKTTRYPTTSFLTATTLIYAIRAGITAAAGTRLAL